MVHALIVYAVGRRCSPMPEMFPPPRASSAPRIEVTLFARRAVIVPSLQRAASSQSRACFPLSPA